MFKKQFYTVLKQEENDLLSVFGANRDQLFLKWNFKNPLLDSICHNYDDLVCIMIQIQNAKFKN